MNEGADEKTEKNKNLTKALAFLFSKEAQEISIEEKKKFLLTKLPEDIVNQAMELYPQIQNLSIDNMNKEKHSNSIFSSLFDVGILSSAILASLLVNFLFDINKEKKNQFFEKELAKKLNEEQQKNNEEIKKEIDSKMEQYIEKKEISSAINQELEIFSQGKGLTVNPSLSKIKKEIDDKEKIINGLIEETTKLKDIMIMNEKAKKREIAKEKEAYTEIKNQIENIEKKIIPIKNENHFIGVDIEKINIILSKKSGDKMKKVKEKMKGYEVDQTYEYEFFGKPKPKIRKTKCMSIDEENHTEPNNKEQNQTVNQHNNKLTIPVINIIPKTNPPTPKHQQIDHSN